MGIECLQPEFPCGMEKIRVDVLDLRVRRRTLARKCDLLFDSSHPTRQDDDTGRNNIGGRVYCVARLGDQHARTRPFPSEGLHEVSVRRTTADDCSEEGKVAVEVEDVLQHVCSSCCRRLFRRREIGKPRPMLRHVCFCLRRVDTHLRLNCISIEINP